MKNITAFLFLGFLVSGLGSISGFSAAQSSWTCPEGFEGQQLSVYNWSTYIADNTIPDFEELCGVTVTYDTYPTDGDMLSRIRQGNPGYDIVVPTASTAQVMIAEGLLQALDFSKIPNFSNVATSYVDPVFDPENKFTVPYQVGGLGVAYNREKVGKDITSWYDVFSYDGPVAWMEDYHVMLSIALNLLGYDPNTKSEEEIGEAKDFLIENGKNVITIAQDDGQELLARGEVDIVLEYSGDIFQVIADCACDTYVYVNPVEGTYFSTDVLGVPLDAPNKALAEVFIDYILDPHVGADISNYTTYASPNQAAIDQKLISEETLSNPAIYPPVEVLEKLFTIVEDPETEVFYTEAWDEVKIALGR
ncbi:MAG: polyamine ABC transporter substrate-binding protein [Trueperaceae bacterium]